MVAAVLLLLIFLLECDKGIDESSFENYERFNWVSSENLLSSELRSYWESSNNLSMINRDGWFFFIQYTSTNILRKIIRMHRKAIKCHDNVSKFHRNASSKKLPCYLICICHCLVRHCALLIFTENCMLESEHLDIHL